MWHLMTEEGIWYPASGMRAFSERLVRVLARQSDAEKALDDSGTIRLGTEVTHIRVEKGKVVGVTLRDGSRIDSPSVISNADYEATFLTLLDRREIPPVWYRAVSRARQTGSVLQVCLGVDKSKADLSSFHEASRLIYRSREGTQPTGGHWNHRSHPGALARKSWSQPLRKKTQRWHRKEKAVVVILTEAQYFHFVRHRLGWRKRAPGYEVYKTRLGAPW